MNYPEPEPEQLDACAMCGTALVPDLDEETEPCVEHCAPCARDLAWMR